LRRLAPLGAAIARSLATRRAELAGLRRQRT
jgi:hypothetical protein